MYTKTKVGTTYTYQFESLKDLELWLSNHPNECVLIDRTGMRISRGE